MEHYIQQLISDLRYASSRMKQEQQENDVPEGDDLEQHFADIERYLHGPFYPLSEIVGIETTLLPPVDRLTDDQARRLYNEIELMLHSFNFIPEFPDNLPEKMKYKLIREKWDSEQTSTTQGHIHMEFCHYEPSECPFTLEFCTCKNLDFYSGEED